jgi:UDP-2,3-diacylglucosamine pyrophosphatase LpxH
MRTSLFVISDLHLGGEPGLDGGPGFQLCPAANQAHLAGFIDTLPSRESDCDVRLAIAGDIVDFLTETEFKGFTLDPAEARAKLRRILDRTMPIWTAVGKFLDRGGALTLMLGNHDVELCLPGVRQTFLDTLGEGRVEFLYDNEAFTLGPVLIEHGNRYDEWNAVRYGALRRVRSQLSRGIVAKEFPTPPGSQLVAEVMNRLKAEYSFIDLLKPEDAGVMPILAALGAGSLRDVWRFFGKYRQTREVEFDDDRQPMDETYIGGPHDPDQEMFNLAEAIAAGGDATQVSAFSDALHGTRATVSAAVREYRRRALLKALRALVTHHRLTFEVDHENPLYLAGAKASAGRGYKVVVYGHTHLVKRISLNGIAGATLPVYVNTGTWSDLIRIPDDVWGEQGAARLALDEFVADLESDHIGRWRRFVPTFARIEVDGDAIRSADVYFADGGADERVTTEGLRRRLSREVSRE